MEPHLKVTSFIRPLRSYGHFVHTATSFIRPLRSYGHFVHTATSFIRSLRSYGHFVHTATSFIRSLRSYGHFVHTATSFIRPLRSYGHFVHTAKFGMTCWWPINELPMYYFIIFILNESLVYEQSLFRVSREEHTSAREGRLSSGFARCRVCVSLD